MSFLRPLVAVVALAAVPALFPRAPLSAAAPPEPTMRPAPAEQVFFRRADSKGHPICWLRLSEEQRRHCQLFDRRRKRRHGFTKIELTTPQIRMIYSTLRLWKIPTHLWLNSSKRRNWYLAVPEESLRNGLVYQGGTPREWEMP